MFKKVIFVTYINRSGSTFFVNSLSKSDNILVCPEAEILIDLFLKTPVKSFDPDKDFFNTLLDAVEKDKKLKHWGIEKDNIIKNIQNEKTYFNAFLAFIDIYRKNVKPEATILVFKAEKLIYYYNIIHPYTDKYNIKFIAIIRDCRAIFYSQNNTLIPESNRKMATNSLKLAKRWNNYINLETEYSENDDFIELSYEALIEDFHNCFIFVCKKINIKPFSQDSKGDLMYRLPYNHRIIHNIMDSQPEISKIYSWNSNLGNTSLYIVEFISGNLLLKKGYKLININKRIHAAIIRLIFEYLSFLISNICKSYIYGYVCIKKK
jgi:hypothetical protein